MQCVSDLFLHKIFDSHIFYYVQLRIVWYFLTSIFVVRFAILFFYHKLHLPMTHVMLFCNMYRAHRSLHLKLRLLCLLLDLCALHFCLLVWCPYFWLQFILSLLQAPISRVYFLWLCNLVQCQNCHITANYVSSDICSFAIFDEFFFFPKWILPIVVKANNADTLLSAYTITHELFLVSVLVVVKKSCFFVSVCSIRILWKIGKKMLVVYSTYEALVVIY